MNWLRGCTWQMNKSGVKFPLPPFSFAEQLRVLFSFDLILFVLCLLQDDNLNLRLAKGKGSVLKG